MSNDIILYFMKNQKKLSDRGLNYIPGLLLGLTLALRVSPPAWSGTPPVSPATVESPSPVKAVEMELDLRSPVAVETKIQDLSLTFSQNPTNSEKTLLSQTPSTPAEPSTPSNNLDLSPEIIEGSPVLQRWLQEVPNVLEEIANDPSFPTRLRLGYSQFPSTGQAAGWNAGVEDVFIGRTGLTVSADYQGTFDGQRKAYGGDLHYYLFPLGGYFNIAPVIGYRNLQTNLYSRDGLNLGLRAMLILSRGGAADISLTQSWVSPGGGDREVGLTTLSVGYAITHNLRLSTDIPLNRWKFFQDGLRLEFLRERESS